MTIAFDVKDHTLEVVITGVFDKKDADSGHDTISDLLKTHDKINMLVDLTGCDKMSKSGIFEDARVNTVFASKVGKMAIVDQHDHHVIFHKLIEDMSGVLPGKVEVFAEDKKDDAGKWLAS